MKLKHLIGEQEVEATIRNLDSAHALLVTALRRMIIIAILSYFCGVMSVLLFIV